MFHFLYETLPFHPRKSKCSSPLCLPLFVLRFRLLLFVFVFPSSFDQGNLPFVSPGKFAIRFLLFVFVFPSSFSRLRFTREICHLFSAIRAGTITVNVAAMAAITRIPHWTHEASQLSQPQVMLRSLAFLGYGKMGTILIAIIISVLFNFRLKLNVKEISVFVLNWSEICAWVGLQFVLELVCNLCFNWSGICAWVGLQFVLELVWNLCLSWSAICADLVCNLCLNWSGICADLVCNLCKIGLQFVLELVWNLWFNWSAICACQYDWNLCFNWFGICAWIGLKKTFTSIIIGCYITVCVNK